MMEEWKSLKGLVQYGDYYEISNTGKIRSVDRYILSSSNRNRFYEGKTISTYADKDGYLLIVLAMHGKKKTYRLHRLVAIAFIPNQENKPEVNHIDGNVINNITSNLEWATGKENTNHAIDTGLTKNKGEHSHTAILKEDDIRKIRNLYATGEYTYKQIATMFNISTMHTCRIVKRERWKHLE